jgi:hypothetical protein
LVVGDHRKHRDGHRKRVRVGWFPGPAASLLMLAVLGCVALTATSRGAAPATLVALRASIPTPASVREAVSLIDDMAGSGPARAEYGVAVLDRQTGRLSVGDEGNVAFYSASVVKLFTVVAILHRAQVGTVTLTSAQRASIQRAIEASDDHAMDALWTAFGGPATVREMIALAGLRNTTPPATRGEWGETKLSPRDVVQVYQYIFTGLNQPYRTMLLNYLSHARSTGADGFNQAFGLLASPRPAGVAAKQGWMIDRTHLYLHSTGLAGPDYRYAVAVLSKQPASVGYPTGRERLDTAIGHLTSALGLTTPDQSDAS